jgi:hypothetical protein
MNALIGRLAACLVSFAGAVALAPAHATYIPLAELDVAESDQRRDFSAETDLYCIALAVYFEEGSTSETLEGQRHIARVVTERARADLSKWGGRDICSVVFYKRGGVCQFSFACLPLARRTPRGGRRWDVAMAIASEELGGRSEVGDGAIRYYMNPALTSDRNACRFRKEFVPVFEAGRHEFFREPDEAERRALASSEPAECKRYKAALELKKKMAKAAAEKRRKALAAKLKGKRSKYARR